MTCRVPSTVKNSDGTYTTETAMNTTVDFVYEVETLAFEDLESYIDSTIPSACDAASIEALARRLCENHECILGFSIGIPDSLIDDSKYCTGSVGEGSCFPYDGTINVWHSIDDQRGCDSASIEDLVLKTLDDEEEDNSATPATVKRTGAMSTDEYIDFVNSWVDAFPPIEGVGARGLGGEGMSVSGTRNVAQEGEDLSEVVLVRIVPRADRATTVAGVASGTQDTNSTPSDEGISPAAWALLALLLLLLLLLLGLLLRRRRRRKKDDDGNLDDNDGDLDTDGDDDLETVGVLDTDGDAGDDLKSFKTDWSSPASVHSGTSYKTANMQNLAFRHSKLDVHKCSSATCEICRSNIGKVDMLPVKQSDASIAQILNQLREDEGDDNNEADKGFDQRRIPSTSLPPDTSVSQPSGESRSLPEGHDEDDDQTSILP